MQKYRNSSSLVHKSDSPHICMCAWNASVVCWDVMDHVVAVTSVRFFLCVLCVKFSLFPASKWSQSVLPGTKSASSCLADSSRAVDHDDWRLPYDCMWAITDWTVSAGASVLALTMMSRTNRPLECLFARLWLLFQNLRSLGFRDCRSAKVHGHITWDTSVSWPIQKYKNTWKGTFPYPRWRICSRFG